MGWRGLPSKACGDCRRRRIKCDLAHPACSQCIRAHIACTGYRDKLDGLFVNQTNQVAAKVKIRAAKQPKEIRNAGGASNQAITLPLRPSSREQLHADLTGFIPTTVPPPVYPQAVCWFLHNYVLESQGHGWPSYGYLPTFYDDIVNRKTVLSFIVHAVGFAGLHGTYSSSLGLMNAASADYEKALQQMQVALRDPATAKSDQTLISVLLFGLYEMNTCSTTHSMKTWMKHVAGAVALIKLRGPGILQSEIGACVFGQLRLQIITLCMKTMTAIPKTIKYIQSLIPVNTENPHSAKVTYLTNISFDICDLRAQIRIHDDGSRARQSVEEAVLIFQRLSKYVALSSQSPEVEAALPGRGIVPSLSEAPIGSHHPEVLSASFYMHCDLLSLTLLEVIVKESERIINHEHCPSRDGTSLRSCSSCRTLVTAARRKVGVVVESFSIQIKRFLCLSAANARSDKAATEDWTKDPRAWSVNAIIWPLLTVGTNACCPESTYRCIVENLRALASAAGVQQARTMADMLEQRQKFWPTLVSEADALWTSLDVDQSG